MATPKQTDPQFKLRLTAVLKQQIEDAATSNNRSINAEIVARLEDSFELNIRLPPLLWGRIADVGRANGRNVQSEAIASLQKTFPRRALGLQELVDVLHAVATDPGLNSKLREEVEDNLDQLIEALKQASEKD